MGKCCMEKCWEQVLWRSVVEGVVKWCRDVLWGSVV